MIPAEAVEAAAKATHALHRSGPRSMEEHRHDARAALEAAAPHMLADCWDAAIEAHKAWMWDDENLDPLTNPYRTAK